MWCGTTSYAGGRHVDAAHPVGPGAGPRGRQLSLHAALGGRRHRSRHHPCHSRRGPRRQYRAADPAVRGAGGSKPPAFGHHSLLVGADGQALSKRTARSPSRVCARRGSSRWRSRATSRPSGPPPRRAACKSRRAGARLRLRQAVARRRRGSIRTSSVLLNAKLLHMLPFDAVAARLRR